MMAQEHKKTCPFCQGFHWHKYQYLEEKLIEISRYVTIDENNFEAWGEEIADIIVLIGNAMDTFFKDMYDCPNFGNEAFKKKKRKLILPDYQRVYQDYYKLSENTMYLQFGLGKAQTLSPFKDFSSIPPVWWEAYNQTKHGFYSSMETANLGNALNLLAGLLILNALHFCSKLHLTQRKVFGGRLNQYETLHQLTTSKIGTTMWGSSLRITTKLFNFSYRVDELIVQPRADPLIIFDAKFPPSYME